MKRDLKSNWKCARWLQSRWLRQKIATNLWKFWMKLNIVARHWKPKKRITDLFCTPADWLLLKGVESVCLIDGLDKYHKIIAFTILCRSSLNLWEVLCSSFDCWHNRILSHLRVLLLSSSFQRRLQMTFSERWPVCLKYISSCLVLILFLSLS